jgi:hypothetical protein
MRGTAIERVAKVMFEKDEASRQSVAGILRMTWDDIGPQYRDNWRERAEAAVEEVIAVLRG